MRWFAATLMTISLLQPTADSSAETNTVFQRGDYVLVRGRLKECLAWEHRPIELRPINDDHALPLLGLPAVQVLGRSAAEVEGDIRALYRQAIPDGGMPPIYVEVVRGSGHFREVLDMYRLNLEFQKNGKCLGVPDPRVPPPTREIPFPPSEVYPNLWMNIAGVRAIEETIAARPQARTETSRRFGRQLVANNRPTKR